MRDLQYMAIDKILKIIHKQTPIPLSTMPWVLYASDYKTADFNTSLQYTKVMEH
jgi:hypothetical protein